MKAKKRKINFKHILLVALTLIIVAGIAVGTVVGKYAYNIYQQVDDYSLNRLTAQTNSELIDQNGKTYYTFGTAKGEYITYNKIPEVLVDAVVATEDARFFKHNGFDIPRIIKALISNIMARGVAQGGSTITQQLVKKTYYPEEQRTIERKLGEIMMSVKVTNNFSKNKVMELYLNKIYFGRNDYSIGVYAASYYYFGKHPSKLTLPEAAMMAGCINSPVSYDPFVNLDKAQSRRDIVLYLMHEHGYINDKMYESAKKIKVAKTLKSKPIKTNRKYAAYADRVAKEVKEKTGFDPNETVMTIYTYMDKETQIFLNNISSGKTYNYTDRDMQVASVVQESDTGRIIGVLPARKYKSGNYSYAAERHQPGSSIKPIIAYGAAFQYLHWCSAQTVDDTKITIGKWSPKNVDGKTHGEISMVNALGNSWNLAAINTLSTVFDSVGKKKVLKYLKRLGYNMKGQTLSLSYAIGGWAYGVTLYEQAAAYAAISNGGKYIEPHTVDYIIMADTGEIVNIDDKCQAKKKQAMSSATAYLLRNVMLKYVRSNKNYSAIRSIGDRNIGAKTGTTNHDGKIRGIPKGASKDKWLCAYSPDYAWACWNGFPGKIQTKKHKYIRNWQTDALNISVRIGRFLKNKKRGKKYKKPKTIVRARMIKGIYPYVKPASFIPNSMTTTAYFAKGYEPKKTITREQYNQMRLRYMGASYSGGVVTVSFSRYAPNGKKTKKVRYHVSIYDGDKQVASRTSSSQSFSIAVSVSKGAVLRVVGYASATGARSNSITQSVATVKKKKKTEDDDDDDKKKSDDDDDDKKKKKTDKKKKKNN